MKGEDDYLHAYQQIDELSDKLARLSHYESPEAMFFDERGMPGRGNQDDTRKSRKKARRNER